MDILYHHYYLPSAATINSRDSSVCRVAAAATIDTFIDIDIHIDADTYTDTYRDRYGQVNPHH